MSGEANRYEDAMRRALRVAAEHHPHPNPQVGAVILADDGAFLSEGAHVEVGTPHAERLAICATSSDLVGATMVVTLEPCVHHGHTPPCTDAIIEAGITRVVIGALDPDERVSGRSAEVLRAAGIEVISGVLAEEIVASDPGYYHQRRTGLPLVTLKTAMTLDGQTAALDGTSQWITSGEARADAHRLRACHDAVLVGAGTLNADDPRLDVRLDDYLGPQPVPVIVAGSRPLLESAQIWERSPLVLSCGEMEIPTGILLVCGGDEQVDLKAGLKLLAQQGKLSVLVEGGASIAGSLWNCGLVTRGSTYVGAKLAGGYGVGVFTSAFETMADSVALEIQNITRMGPDFRVDWQAE